ncbi:WXG100 family type VII secretion target [Phytohabitans sp. ZYX-F-186]|uniref:ESAT-6-like protein n=1 Tax=Phytohabitans maris TaxID=3071409 RepID=A0ABU0ZMW3_9ACTN|nr:WXG100 family type VII secretion target [Phytohabitans sp. ZYX-F-186]MDQ7908383.1 WXG100 family type VII secretion target [Phytohabitans sp. ZYX-F-186]
MDRTEAEAAVLERTAAKFDQVNRDLDAMLKALMSQLEVLRGAWQGAGGRSFEQVKTEWADDQAAIQRTLGETAAALRAAGRGYDAADDQAAGRLAATHRGIDLPL